MRESGDSRSSVVVTLDGALICETIRVHVGANDDGLSDRVGFKEPDCHSGTVGSRGFTRGFESHLSLPQTEGAIGTGSSKAPFLSIPPDEFSAGQVFRKSLFIRLDSR